MSGKRHAAILAGGRSERMGFPKVMLAKEDDPLIRSMAEKLNRTDWSLACIVVSSDRLAEWVGRIIPGVPIVQNLSPEHGAISSLRLALQSSPEDSAGLLALPMDHPLVEEGTLIQLRRASLVQNVMIPCFEGKRGHPTWWGKKSWKLLKSQQADFGANKILGDSRLNLAELEVQDPGVLINIDRPEEAAQFGLTCWKASDGA